MERSFTTFRRLTQAALIALATLAGATQIINAQTIFTGVFVASTDANGSPMIGSRWNTRGGDSIVNVFVTTGPELDNRFFNGPQDFQSHITIPLNLGDNHFTLFGPGGNFFAHHSIGLEFNGGLSPAIAAFAATQTGPIPPFAALPPGLSFVDEDRIITLTSFSWAAPGVYGVDRVGAWIGNPGTVGADGIPDWIGHITLNVTLVPEPTTGALLGLGLAGLLAFRRRNR